MNKNLPMTLTIENIKYQIGLNLKKNNPTIKRLAQTLPYDCDTIFKVCADIKDIKIAESFLIYCFRKHYDPINKLNWLKNKL